MDVVTALLALVLAGLAGAAWLRVRHLRRRGRVRPPTTYWGGVMYDETTAEPPVPAPPDDGEGTEVPAPAPPPDDGEEEQASQS